MQNLLIIVPSFNEEAVVTNFYDSIRRVSNLVSILFVDDGSTDKTLEQIKTLAKKDNKIYYISFSKNFGKEAAIFCGLNKSKNSDYDFITVMDIDGQDPSSLLPEMYNALISNEYDAVSCRRINRKGEGIIRSFFSSLFYKIIKIFTKANIPEGARDYIMMNKTFRDALLLHQERCRFFKGLYTSIGFKIKWLEYENIHTEDRKSKWSFINLLSYALEGIISSSEVLLYISAITGIVFFVISFIFLLFVFFRTIIFGDPVPGWTSLVCIILFLFGIQFIFIGIIGLYISKNYKELKNRPIYIERESNI